MATKAKDAIRKSVFVSDKQVAMLTEALGLVDHFAPHFRESALAFARASELGDAIRLLERSAEARDKLKREAQRGLGFDADLKTGS